MCHAGCPPNQKGSGPAAVCTFDDQCCSGVCEPLTTINATGLCEFLCESQLSAGVDAASFVARGSESCTPCRSALCETKPKPGAGRQGGKRDTPACQLAPDMHAALNSTVPALHLAFSAGCAPGARLANETCSSSEDCCNQNCVNGRCEPPMV